MIVCELSVASGEPEDKGTARERKILLSDSAALNLTTSAGRVQGGLESKSHAMELGQLAHQERLDGFALFAQVSVTCDLRAWA